MSRFFDEKVCFSIARQVWRSFALINVFKKSKQIGFMLFVAIFMYSLPGSGKDSVMLFEQAFNSPDALDSWCLSGRKARLLPVGGPNNNSGAVRFHVPNMGGSSLMSREIDRKGVKGLICFQADVKAEKLVPGKKPYLGPKFMLVVETGGKTHYLEPEKEFGTYNWKTTKRYYILPDKTSSITLVGGIQQGQGTFYISNIKVYSTKKIETQTDLKAVREALRKKAALMPRGKFKGTKYRGVMSGTDLSAKAFAELKKWNVNLMRYQMDLRKSRREGFKGDVSTPEGYLKWIDLQIKELDKILLLAEKNGIKIVIDLHTGSGTGITTLMSNELGESTALGVMVEAWRKLAKHYKGNPNIYGYDLLNEPQAGKFLEGRDNPWKYMAQTLADAIRKIDPDTPIIVAWHQISKGFKIKGENIIYSPHIYKPHTYTHQGMKQWKLQWKYPGNIDGTYWNKDQLRLVIRKYIDYQQRHGVKIFVGEFGCIAWAPGRERYIKDCIELFEEYGWDWTYHAFREYSGWSCEYEGDGFGKLKKSTDTPTKRVLLKAFKLNR